MKQYMEEAETGKPDQSCKDKNRIEEEKHFILRKIASPDNHYQRLYGKGVVKVNKQGLSPPAC